MRVDEAETDEVMDGSPVEEDVIPTTILHSKHTTGGPVPLNHGLDRHHGHIPTTHHGLILPVHTQLSNLDHLH